MFVNSAQRANAEENYPPFVNQIRHNTHRATPNAHHRAKALPLPAVIYFGACLDRRRSCSSTSAFSGPRKTACEDWFAVARLHFVDTAGSGHWVRLTRELRIVHLRLASAQNQQTDTSCTSGQNSSQSERSLLITGKAAREKTRPTKAYTEGRTAPATGREGTSAETDGSTIKSTATGPGTRNFAQATPEGREKRHFTRREIAHCTSSPAKAIKRKSHARSHTGKSRPHAHTQANPVQKAPEKGPFLSCV